MVTLNAAPERETAEGVPGSGRALAATLPEPNEDYFYVATRLLSWFPVVNSKGATYSPDDFNDDILGTLIGKQVNLYHDKAKQVVGRVIAYDTNVDGIDVAIEVDREQADAHGFDVQDLNPGNAFSTVSVELTKDADNSNFLAFDTNYNVARSYPVPLGRKMGIRRTTDADPYLLQGQKVAEQIKPLRFTGVGFVPNPADRQAQVFAVAADDTSVDQLKTSHTASESDALLQENILHMSDTDVQALLDKITLLETTVASLTAEREAASTEAAKVGNLQAEITQLTDKLAIKETEMASVVAERDQLVGEKETAAREDRISKIVADLEAILPAKDDAERAALRENASQACDDAGVIRTLVLERTVAQQAARIVELTTEVPADVTISDAPEKTEKASDGSEVFVAGNRPLISTTPTYPGLANAPTSVELDAIF